MDNKHIDLSPSPLMAGQVKEKPQKSLAQGVVQRLTLAKPYDVAVARTTVRKLADELGYSLIDQVRISTAIFEIADHILSYAGLGEIVVYWHEDEQHKGLQFCCSDQGRHAPKLTNFFKHNMPQAGENGSGILSPRRLVDTFEFSEDPQHGNCINMSIWFE
jgi:serine/threonine-protein kinase RsbT